MKLLPLLLLLACAPTEDSAPADADGDGYSWYAGDCDDADPEVFPGADDAWYDGVDSDCAGNDDHDADGDFSPAPDDCNDEDPAVLPGALETYGDALDADCDGDPDGAGFVQFTTASGDTRGPRLASLADGEVALMLLDDSPAAFYRRWNPSTAIFALAYSTSLEGYAFGAPLAFAPADYVDAIGASVYAEGSTYLALVSIDAAGGDSWRWVGWGWPTDDLAEFLATDVQVDGEVVTVLGCALGSRLSGPVLLLRGTVEEFRSHAYAYAYARTGSGGEACVLDGDDVLVLGEGACTRFTYDGSSLDEGEGWGRGYRALAAGDGLVVAAQADEIELREGADDDPVRIAVTEVPDLVRVARAPDGSARVLWRSGGKVWLYSSVTDESRGLTIAEDVVDAAVAVSADGAVVVAVRTASAVWVSTVIGG